MTDKNQRSLDKARRFPSTPCPRKRKNRVAVTVIAKGVSQIPSETLIAFRRVRLGLAEQFLDGFAAI
ncbi:MAG: hypothetical protein N2C14_19435, partial [Planctomycetales bacterium]